MEVATAVIATVGVEMAASVIATVEVVGVGRITKLDSDSFARSSSVMDVRREG